MKFMSMNTKYGATYHEENGDDGGEGSAGGADGDADADEGDEAGTGIILGGDKDTGDGKKEGDEKKEGEEGYEAETAPETYADFELPDGMEIDGKMLETASELFKADNLSQERAQEYVAAYAGAIQGANEAVAQQHVDQVKEWETQLNADKEIGGDNLAQSLARTDLALKTHGTPDLTTWLNKTGLSNNPDLIRFMSKVGATLQEDNPHGGDGGGGKGISKEEQALKDQYPDEYK